MKPRTDNLKLNDELAGIIGLLTRSQLETAERLGELIKTARNLNQAKRMAATIILLLEGGPIPPSALPKLGGVQAPENPKSS